MPLGTLCKSYEHSCNSMTNHRMTATFLICGRTPEWKIILHGIRKILDRLSIALDWIALV